MNTTHKTIIAMLFAGASVSAFARTLTIGIDLSGSNPLLTHPNFAHAAAEHAGKTILALNDGDVVQVRSFGARGDAHNLLSTSLIIGRRNRPKKIAEALRAYLESLPEQGAIAQGSTNLLAWLEFGAGYACARGGEILVITDGVESSSLVDGKALLQGKTGLPKPNVNLKGCTLRFFGLGTGLPAPMVMRLRDQWTRWSDQAGASFTPIIP